MARNKNPEETIQLILDVSTRLFMEKGDINYLYASESVVTTEHGFAVAEKHVKENPWI